MRRHLRKGLRRARAPERLEESESDYEDYDYFGDSMDIFFENYGRLTRHLFEEVGQERREIWILKNAELGEIEKKWRRYRNWKSTRILCSFDIATTIAQYIDSPRDLYQFAIIIKADKSWPFLITYVKERIDYLVNPYGIYNHVSGKVTSANVLRCLHDIFEKHGEQWHDTVVKLAYGWNMPDRKQCHECEIYWDSKSGFSDEISVCSCCCHDAAFERLSNHMSRVIRRSQS